ncbi:hypothetical protein P9112_002492 [Eukaryota sp. TZLM1-RC]
MSILSGLKLCIKCSDDSTEEKLLDIAEALGGRIRPLKKSDVLIVDDDSTCDTSNATQLNIPAVSTEWLLDSQAQNERLQYTAYLVNELPQQSEQDPELDPSMFATQQDLTVQESSEPVCPPAPKKVLPSSSKERKEMSKDSLPASQTHMAVNAHRKRLSFDKDSNEPDNTSTSNLAPKEEDEEALIEPDELSTPITAVSETKKANDPFQFKKVEKTFRTIKSKQKPLTSSKVERSRLTKEADIPSQEQTTTKSAGSKRKTSNNKPGRKKKNVTIDAEIDEYNYSQEESVHEVSSDDDAGLSMSSGSIKIAFSACPEGFRKKLSKLRKVVGRDVCEIVDTMDPSEVEAVNVLVHGGLMRTAKLCFAITSGSTIVTTEWVDECIGQKKLVNPIEFESTLFPGCKAGRLFLDALERQAEKDEPLSPRLLEGLTILIDKKTCLNHNVLAKLVASLKPKSILSLTRTLPSVHVDYCLVHKDSTKIPKNARGVVVKETWLYDCITAFKLLPHEDYCLGVANEFTASSQADE